MAKQNDKKQSSALAPEAAASSASTAGEASPPAGTRYRATLPGFRDGVAYPAGAALALKEGEVPGRTWVRADGEEKPAPVPALPAEESGARANDVSPV